MKLNEVGTKVETKQGGLSGILAKRVNRHSAILHTEKERTCDTSKVSAEGGGGGGGGRA